MNDSVSRTLKITLCALAAFALFLIGDRIGGGFADARSLVGVHSALPIADAFNIFTAALIAAPVRFYATVEGLLSGLFLAFVCFAALSTSSRLRGGFYAKGEEHGTARIEGPSSLAGFADPAKPRLVGGITYDTNMILSANVRKRLSDRAPERAFSKVSNIAVIAESGGGKSAEYVIPNMLQQFGSMVVVDTKGELYKNFGDFARQTSKVRVLNTTQGMRHSQGFNPLRYCTEPEDIPEICDIIIASTTGKDEKQDWFAKAEGALLQSLICYAMEAIGSDGEEVSLPDIMDLLALVSRDEATGIIPFELLLEDLDRAKGGCLAKEFYAGYSAFSDSPKTTASILGSVHIRLKNLKTPSARLALSHDEMDLRSITQERTTVFVIIDSTPPRPYEFVSALFFTLLIKTIARQAMASANGRIDVPTHIMIDETRHVGKISILPDAMAQIRSMGASISTVWQNYGQMKDLYGEEGAAEIWQNSPTKIFMGGDDPETNEILSKSFGEGTVKKRSESESHGKNQSSSMSSQTLSRRVVMPDELGRMRPPYEFVKISGFFPVKDTRYDFHTHPNYRFTAYETKRVCSIDDISPSVTPVKARSIKNAALDGIDSTKVLYLQDIDWLNEQKGRK